ncbi:MAG: IclR family transcriptional regulator [Pigmentiphaga sp.]|nr:IclR family transcriptional regulator [Pigmentiphaga sp.]
MEKPGESVRAVERALDILRAFTPEDSQLSAVDLARRVHLSRPTLYRLLYTLEKQGFIVSEGDPQRFRLGPAIGRLAHSWSASLDLGQLAQPVLQRVWQITRETVALFVPEGNRRICVAELPCPQPLAFRRGIGYSETIVRGASGRAILAFLPEGVLELEPAITPPPDLEQLLAEVRERGYATSRDELIDGAVAVAAPFFDRAGEVMGSIAVFGPAVRIDEARNQELIGLLRDAAAELSHLLGYDGPIPPARGDGARPVPARAASPARRARKTP